MDCFLGTVQAFAFNFEPRGWMKCDGRLLSISSHTALYSLLGTMYGGDGHTTFALPNLNHRIVRGGNTGGYDGGNGTVTEMTAAAGQSVLATTIDLNYCICYEGIYPSRS